MTMGTFSKRIIGTAALLLLGMTCVVMVGLPRAHSDDPNSNGDPTFESVYGVSPDTGQVISDGSASGNAFYGSDSGGGDLSGGSGAAGVSGDNTSNNSFFGSRSTAADLSGTNYYGSQTTSGSCTDCNGTCSYCYTSTPCTNCSTSACTDCNTCTTCSSYYYPILYPTNYASSYYVSPPSSQPTPALQVSCAPSATTVNVGQTMTWNANVSGGTGSYQYSWQGSDGLVGNAGSVGAYYNSPGTDTASVTVISGSRSKTAICPAIQVVPIQYPKLSVSCSVDQASLQIGGTANWSSQVSGGNGQYTYAWAGSDALSGTGPTVSKLYSSAGSKTGILTVSSGDGQVANVNCGNVFVSNIQLNVSCSVSPSQAAVGNSVLWSAQATGGSGNYSYAWSGTDGLSGNGSTVSYAYDTGGTKDGRVTVTSDDGQSGSADCGTVTIQQPQNLQSLSVSCNVFPNGQVQVNQTVTWHATASGGDGNYSYSWSGSDNLNGSGDSVGAYYATGGTQTAQVVVTSAGQTAQATCPTLFVQPNQLGGISASCFATPSTVTIGQPMTWQANVSGGSNGSYNPSNFQYYWSGSDNLSGNGPTIGAYYNTPGTQYASVTVTDPSSGQSQSVQCAVPVQVIAGATVSGVTVQAAYSEPNTPGAAALSSRSVLLSQVPYTGLSDYWKPILFIVVLLLVCGFVAYWFAFRKTGY